MLALFSFNRTLRSYLYVETRHSSLNGIGTSLIDRWMTGDEQRNTGPYEATDLNCQQGIVQVDGGTVTIFSLVHLNTSLTGDRYVVRFMVI